MALLRAALAWVVQESMLGDGEHGGRREDGRGPRVPLYGDFRAAREAAEEVRGRGAASRLVASRDQEFFVRLASRLPS